jgi:hypothetical protein
MTGRKEESPDLGQEVRASGIESLNGRLDRYGKAKKRALDVSKYMAAIPELVDVSDRVASCGSYLVFRHYFTLDEVKLHKAFFCSRHILCPLCAIRRGARALQAYLPRYEAICSGNPSLRPFLVTLTVKDGADLQERFEHLQNALKALWNRRRVARSRPCALSDVQAAVWSYEVKRGSGSGLWHPHLHMVALAAEKPSQADLSAQWREITGDSYVVDVRPITDPVDGFLEVFKYALKFSDMTEADTVAAYRVLAGRRLVASAGQFRGVVVPETLTDDPIEGMPYVDLFFRWYLGRYSLARRSVPTPQ